MKSTIGEHIKISLFGESHGEAIGVVMDGLAPGIKLDMEFIQAQMERRKAKGRISTQRREPDEIEIVSGYFNGYTTGTPLTIIIKNTSQHSADYEKTKDRLRPSHADFTADEKYLGFQDYRGGGHFSGRITAPIVAAGAIALQILKEKGIDIATHIQSCHGIQDDAFAFDEIQLNQQVAAIKEHEFPVIDEAKGRDMVKEIEAAANVGDSVGGILEAVILHMPSGIGEPYFHSIESVLSQYLFSVPAVKGLEFGLGFGFQSLFGSEANDAIYFDEAIKTRSNHNGGINGGIANGMPIVLRCVVKPTPSIYKEQETINKTTHLSEQLCIQGRHDPAIIHRANVVVQSVIALGILDLYIERHATLSMR